MRALPLILLLGACGGHSGHAADAALGDAASLDGAIDAAPDDGSVDAGPPPPPTGATIAVGTYNTCVAIANGGVKCWGWNNAGELGLGDQVERGNTAATRPANLPVVSLGTGRKVLAMSAGWYHTCAILDDYSLRCWGSDSSGQCGLGDSTLHGDEPGEMGDALPAVNLGSGRSARAVSSGETHTCVLLDNGQVKCFGTSEYGQLGRGNTATVGESPAEMGNALPAVDLGTSHTALAIAVGRSHSCALLDSHQVKCWGRNNGQLGLGDVANRGDQPGEMGDALPVVPLGTGRTAIAIAAGDSHTCALLDNHTVKCWGIGYDGQLGQGSQTYYGDNPNELGDALPPIALGTGRSALAMVANGDFTCVLRDDHSLVCFGVNITGELGQNRQDNWGLTPAQMGDGLVTVNLGTGRTVMEVVAGNSDVCVHLDDGTLKCWGFNSFGQLGLGDTNTRGDSGGEMGDALPVIPL